MKCDGLVCASDYESVEERYRTRSEKGARDKESDARTHELEFTPVTITIALPTLADGKLMYSAGELHAMVPSIEEK